MENRLGKSEDTDFQDFVQISSQISDLPDFF